jgi:hypothetical protein
LAVFLPIASMRFLSPRDDPWMVGWILLLGEGSHNIVPCHHPTAILPRLT